MRLRLQRINDAAEIAAEVRNPRQAPAEGSWMDG
jgi:hypothetical protein